MKTSVLIEKLKASTGPDRALDGYIAMVVGFKKKYDVIKDKKTGSSVKRTVWIEPAGEKYVPIPHYTSSIDDARELTRQILDGAAAGFSWKDGEFSAVLNDGPVSNAATPPLALCIAALSYSIVAERNEPPTTS